MSDDSKQPEPDTEPRRRVTADPRLAQQRAQASALAQGAMISGWAAGLAVIVLVFWWAITKKFGLGPQVMLAVAVLAGIFWGWVYRESLKSAAAGRAVRMGTNSALFAVFVLGILVLVNFIGSRHHWRKDLTENKLFSLSDQTRQVVKGLKQEVGMIAFVPPERDRTAEIGDRLREYDMLSGKLKLETYDPMTNREKVDEYDVTMTGITVIVKSGEREEKVYGGDEERLTSAVLAVTSGEKTRIYFLVGHGEVSYEGSEQQSIGTIKSLLESQQYELKTLNLAMEAEPKVPKDCAVLVIAGPKEPLSDKETSAVSNYADQAGKLLVALEPNGPDLSELLEPHGIKPLSGQVYDPRTSVGGSPVFPAVMNLGSHKTTEQLATYLMALPTTRGFEILESEEPEQPMYPDAPPPAPRKRGVALFESGGDAWLENSSPPNGQKDAGERSGPVVMAAAVDEGEPEPPPYPGMEMPEPDENALRMVVLGDAEMMMDAYVLRGLMANAYFVLNSINWLLENEKLISIPPKDDMPKFVTMTAQQTKLVAAFTAIIVPLLVIVSGAVVWWRRR